ncbi:MAG: hypothetical protein GF372_11230 [Candidatus Marinimicrobia bacterium]|nr:hypothetical protein [Candidatus Neomarinimicrobiota bacterium]
MGAFLGISLWVALATVVPGLVTIAVVFTGLAISDIQIIEQLSELDSNWIGSSIAITVMILTQAFGILLEEVLIKHRLYGRQNAKIPVPSEFRNTDDETIDGYEEYSGIYILFAQLSEQEDAQGHLKRAAAQFFLTNNTLVSFIIGIIVTGVLMIQMNTYSSAEFIGLIIYLALLMLCLGISYKVGIIRFRVLVKSLWATKIARKEQ